MERIALTVVVISVPMFGHTFFMKKYGIAIIISVISLCVVICCVALLLSANHYQLKYKTEIKAYSATYNVDPALVASIISTESNFNENAVSKAGACGLGQILPSTATWIAQQLNMQDYDIFDPKTNIEFTCFYLSYLSKRFLTAEEVVAAYNAGENKVREWRGTSAEFQPQTITYPETKTYLNKVTTAYKYYSKKF